MNALGRIAIAAVLGIGLVGCAGGRGDPPPAVHKPGLHWEHFPDLPTPPSWKAVAGEDQVAVAIGGGAARRLQLSLQAPPARNDIQPDEAMRRQVASLLPDFGWQRREAEGRPDDLVQHWIKGDEVLEIQATREGGLATLRYRLVLPTLK